MNMVNFSSVDEWLYRDAPKMSFVLGSHRGAACAQEFLATKSRRFWEFAGEAPTAMPLQE